MVEENVKLWKRCFFQSRAREQMLLGGQQTHHQGVAFWFHVVAQGRGFDKTFCKGGVCNLFIFSTLLLYSAFICTSKYLQFKHPPCAVGHVPSRAATLTTLTCGLDWLCTCSAEFLWKQCLRSSSKRRVSGVLNSTDDFLFEV